MVITMGKSHASTLIIGSSGSGKSYFATYILMNLKTRYKVIIDPSSEYEIPGFAIVEINPMNYREMLKSFHLILKEYQNVIVQFDFFTIEQQKEIVNYIAGLLFHVRNVAILFDEAHLYLDRYRPIPNGLLIATAGRKYGIHPIFITQRPQLLNSTIRSQTWFKIIMHVDDPRDVEAIRGYVYRAELAPHLPERWFLFRNRRGKVFLGTTNELQLPHGG